MRAMQLRSPRSLLEMADLDLPRAAAGQLLVKVRACGVCRTDLHVVDGDLPNAKSPIVPGHEVVGTVAEIGSGVAGFKEGDRVGIPWLGFTCGQCRYCRTGRENLCDAAHFTGYDIDGGYAEYTVADSRYCFPLPALLRPRGCATALRRADRTVRRMAGERSGGIYGFGAAAPYRLRSTPSGREVFAFTRLATGGAAVARELGRMDRDNRPAPSRSMQRYCSPPLWFPALKYSEGRHGHVPASIYERDSAFPYDVLWGSAASARLPA